LEIRVRRTRIKTAKDIAITKRIECKG